MEMASRRYWISVMSEGSKEDLGGILYQEYDISKLFADILKIKIMLGRYFCGFFEPIRLR